MGDICEQFHLDPNEHYLYTEQTDNEKGMSLFPWSSLKELNIPYSARLVLKQKKGNMEQGYDFVHIWDEPKKHHESGTPRGYTLNDLVIQLSTEKEYGEYEFHL